MIHKKNYINYVVCPNGFGHFSRAIKLIKELNNINIYVNLYTKKKEWSKFHPRKLRKNCLIDTNELPIAQNYKKGKSLDIFFEKLSLTLLNSNLTTISDNYPELIIKNNKIILLCNFFWHKELNKVISQKNQNLCNKLLKNHKLKIFGNKYFARNYIKQLPNYYPIGFFDNENVKINKKKKFQTVYVAIGFGNHNKAYKFKILKIVNNLKIKNKKLKFIYDINFKEIKNTSKLSSSVLKKTDLIIGRPSLGLVNQSFSYKIPFIPILFKNDKECYYNGKIIKKMFSNTDNIDLFFKNYQKNSKKYKFEFNSEKVITKYIKKIIK